MLKKCKQCKNSLSIESFYIKDKKKGVRSSLCKECDKRRIQKYRSTPIGKYKAYKSDSKRRGLAFELTFKQFCEFENIPCHYCGDIPETISLDRVDNDIGYLYYNVVSCCYTCNSIKHIYEEHDFLKHIEKIYLYQQRAEKDE